MKKLIPLLMIALLLVGCGEKQELVVIHTDYGDIKIKLYDETPQHKANFLKLAKSGYYDGTLFHRCIQGFMIQGGDPDSKNAQAGQMLGNGGPAYTIPAEFVPKYFHKRGAVAAARQGDNVNPQKASSGSQFYIAQGKVYNDQELNQMQQQMNTKFSPEQIEAYKTVGGIPHLDGSYTVFGEVVEGMDVVDKIAALPRDANDRPLTDVKMTMKVVEETVK